MRIISRSVLSRFMLVTNLVCNLFYSVSYPYIYAEMMKVVSSTYVSVEQIVTCVGVITLGLLWNKFGDFLYKHFQFLIILEIVADIILFSNVLITGNLKAYFIMNISIYAFISRHIVNGGIRLRAKVHPDEHSRERYDNNCNIVNSVATLLGAGLAIILHLNVTMLFIAALIGNTFDNFCYWYIYKKVNQIEKDEQLRNQTDNML